MNREDIQTVLGYLKAHADKGACRIPDVRTLAGELAMKPGRVQAVLYWLCGEGVILREGDIVLLLEEA